MSSPSFEDIQKRSTALRAGWATRKRYVHTDATDAAIAHAYHLRYQYANLKAISSVAIKLGWPASAIKTRARKLGLAKTKERYWTDPEEQLLERWGFLDEARIQGKLAASGFRRTKTAIHLKMKRLKVRSNLDGWTMRQFAEKLGIDDHKVGLWIKHGLLTTEKTGVKCGPNEKVFISREAARRFLLHHPDEVDHTRCEKFWLFDLLSNGKLCEEFRREAA